MMDHDLYQNKLKKVLSTRVRMLNNAYTYVRSTKTWKVVGSRCSICNKGFNKNSNNNFDTHICKNHK